jgi:signal peptidase complex subunit 3
MKIISIVFIFHFQVNQVVLWDKIIQRGENALLDYKSMNTKYYFWDDGNGLR